MKIVSFSDDNRYDKRRVDYYFKRQNKLIIVYATDSVAFHDIHKLFNIDSLSPFRNKILCNNELKEAEGNLYVSNYQPELKTYQIINFGLFKENINKPLPEYIATDKYGIKSDKINEVINNYINSHPSVLYLLKFKKIKGKLYFAFENSDLYESKGLNGYLFRNNHLIAVYNIKDGNKIVSQQYIHNVKKINGYKQAILDKDWLLNRPLFFHIESREEISPIEDFTICYEIVL